MVISSSYVAPLNACSLVERQNITLFFVDALKDLLLLFTSILLSFIDLLLFSLDHSFNHVFSVGIHIWVYVAAVESVGVLFVRFSLTVLLKLACFLHIIIIPRLVVE